MSGFRRLYGASPAHLAAFAASLAVAFYALSRILGLVSDPRRVVVWLLAAVLLHDLVLLPAYTLAGRGAGAVIAPASRRTRLRVAALNHLRAPALLSGLLLLVWWPVVGRKAPRTYLHASGLSVDPYLGRWLAATAVLFVGSALILMLRLRSLRRSGDETITPAPERARH